MSILRRRSAALILSCTLGLGVAGCGSEDNGGVIAGGDPDTPVTSRPATDTPTTDVQVGTGGAHLVEPTPGLDNVVVTAIDSAVIVDDTTIEAHFYNGVQPCYGVDHATLEESPTAVIVEVGVGSNTDAGGVACIELAELQAVRLTLAEPLGDRGVVDASTGQPVPATEAG